MLAGVVVDCCELGLVLGDAAAGFCELSCCVCWLDSGASPAIAMSCPQQWCHAGKITKAVSDRRSDLRMTLISLSMDGSVGPE